MLFAEILLFSLETLPASKTVKMSLKTLPLLFINLGGEMLYILDQRLRAQNIAKDKASKGGLQCSKIRTVRVCTSLPALVG